MLLKHIMLESKHYECAILDQNSYALPGIDAIHSDQISTYVRVSGSQGRAKAVSRRSFVRWIVRSQGIQAHFP
jgi:hypothetical protein